jgi:hypothetical protein
MNKTCIKGLKFKIIKMSIGCWYIYEKTTDKYLCLEKGKTKAKPYLNESTDYKPGKHVGLINYPGYYASREEARETLAAAKKQYTIRIKS